jgi:ankyrin repeat protein
MRALMCVATVNDWPNIVRILMNAKASATQTYTRYTSRGSVSTRTRATEPIVLAAQLNCCAALRAMLQATASASTSASHQMANTVTNGALSLLLYRALADASGCGHIEAMRVLLDAKADVGATTNMNQNRDQAQYQAQNQGAGNHAFMFAVMDMLRGPPRTHAVQANAGEANAGHLAQADAGHLAQANSGHLAQADAGHLAQADAGHLAQADAGHLAQADLAQADAGHLAQANVGHLAQAIAEHADATRSSVLSPLVRAAQTHGNLRAVRLLVSAKAAVNLTRGAQMSPLAAAACVHRDARTVKFLLFSKARASGAVADSTILASAASVPRNDATVALLLEALRLEGKTNELKDMKNEGEDEDMKNEGEDEDVKNEGEDVKNEGEDVKNEGEDMKNEDEDEDEDEDCKLPADQAAHQQRRQRQAAHRQNQPNQPNQAAQRQNRQNQAAHRQNQQHQGKTVLAKILGAKDDDARTALAGAVTCGRNAPTVRLLVEAKAALDGEGAADEYGNTPLIMAAEQGRTNAVRVLLEAKARVDARNQNECTALMRAARFGHVAAVQLLVSFTADLHARDEHGRTAFWHGADGIESQRGCLDHKDVIRVLAAAKAVVDDDNHGNTHGDLWTPLQWATIRGRASIVKVLLEVKAQPDRVVGMAANKLLENDAVSGEESEESQESEESEGSEESEESEKNERKPDEEERNGNEPNKNQKKNNARERQNHRAIAARTAVLDALRAAALDVGERT